MSDSIHLEEITKGYSGLTPTTGAHMLDGCVVTLCRQGHSSGVSSKVKGLQTEAVELFWNRLFDDQLDRTWKDQEEATEQAAVCLAILFALKYTEMEVIERSIKTTGCDYWLGTKEDKMFNRKARLEISGIFNGDEQKVEARFKSKCKQTDQSTDSGLPAYVSISEFKVPLSKFDLRK